MSEFKESDLIFARDWNDEDWKLFRYIGRTENGCYMCVSESSYQDFCDGGFYCQIFIQGRKAFDYEVTEYRGKNIGLNRRDCAELASKIIDMDNTGVLYEKEQGDE